MNPVSAACEQCGNTYTKKQAKQRFCCSKCNERWQNANRSNPHNYRFACKVCGKQVDCYAAPSELKNRRRIYCSQACRGRDQSGEKSGKWRGGRLVKNGYISVLCHGHPKADCYGYVSEHRLVMEAMIGRYLSDDEVVHHIDFNPANNDPGNLMLFPDNAAHKAYEYQFRKTSNGRLLPKEDAA